MYKTEIAGFGYRLLQYGETIEKDDEFYHKASGEWVKTGDPGKTLSYRTFLIYRRKIQQENQNMTQTKINVNRKQFQEIYDLVCAAWQEKLLKRYNFSIVDSIDIELLYIEQSLMSASLSLSKKIKSILNIKEEYPKKGVLLLIKFDDRWEIRISDGQGNYYINQNKNGPTSPLSKETYMLLDMNNLPKELILDE